MRKQKTVLFMLISLWVLAIGFGLSCLMSYDNTPGISSESTFWPHDSQLTLAADRPTLVFFAHPQCPCTGASIDDLAVLMNKYGTRVRAYALFLHPQDSLERWDRSKLRRRAEKIPGLIVLDDSNGIESHLFKSVTSGQTLLYAPNGKLLFCGGITIARGQSGNNAGLLSLMAILDGHSPASIRTPVFGCSLQTPSNGRRN